MTQVIEVEEETVMEETGFAPRLQSMKLARDLQHSETAKWHKTSKLWLMRHTRWLQDALRKRTEREGRGAHRSQTAQLAPGTRTGNLKH